MAAPVRVAMPPCYLALLMLFLASCAAHRAEVGGPITFASSGEEQAQARCARAQPACRHPVALMMVTAGGAVRPVTRPRWNCACDQCRTSHDCPAGKVCGS